MSIDVDSDLATSTLEDLFMEVQAQHLAGKTPPIDGDLIPAFDALFSTKIQSYREALLGCAVARLQNKAIDVRLPYAGQGRKAFNARTLDEEAVNPFFQQHRIPASRGPYLAMFRRDFRFVPSKRMGQRDTAVFDWFLSLIDAIATSTKEDLRLFTAYLLYRFALLREAAEIPLSRLQRISLEQYDALIGRLLHTPSGGRLPAILVVAAFKTINDFFGKKWLIEFQGINVADGASGAGGDITITEGGKIVFAAEVTERPMERKRVVATFNTKIAPNGIEDYLFFVQMENLSEEAKQQARQYFAQGLEMNFLEIKTWVLASLATTGKVGRELFNAHLLDLLSDRAIPRQLKVAWNDYIDDLTQTK